MPKRKIEKSASQVLRKRCKLPTKRELNRIFEKYVADGSDVIDRSKLGKALKDVLSDAPLSKSEVVEVVQDTAAGPELSFDDFLEVAKAAASLKTKRRTMLPPSAPLEVALTRVAAPALRRSPRNKKPIPAPRVVEAVLQKSSKEEPELKQLWTFKGMVSRLGGGLLCVLAAVASSRVLHLHLTQPTSVGVRSIRDAIGSIVSSPQAT